MGVDAVTHQRKEAAANAIQPSGRLLIDSEQGREVGGLSAGRHCLERYGHKRFLAVQSGSPGLRSEQSDYLVRWCAG